ncbi:hypothetical protein QN277_016668 [Acacia crassicarpa]|uniref:Uncharacterized protein n=1 Tax=Acacia crassicarpa TaxID=499986 RepID=A0AAE1MX38_9FABA|nr:hypothetical protein QN277_016668 [Acacia crassicarpa]
MVYSFTHFSPSALTPQRRSYLTIGNRSNLSRRRSNLFNLARCKTRYHTCDSLISHPQSSASLESVAQLFIVINVFCKLLGLFMAVQDCKSRGMPLG